MNDQIFWESSWNEPMSEEQHYHRGYCCGNRCQKCVYEPKYEKGSTKVRKEVLNRLNEIK